MENLGTLVSSKNSLKIRQDASSRASILGTPIITLGGDRIKSNENIYDLTPEINKALSSTSYCGKTMKEESDFLTMNIIINH